MKNISAGQMRVSGGSIKGWLIGIGCGVGLTLSLLIGTGQVSLHQADAVQPVSVVSDTTDPNAQPFISDQVAGMRDVQAAVLIGSGAVPPSINEMRDFKLQQQAAARGTGLVPPSINEMRDLKLQRQAAANGTGLVPPSINEMRDFKLQQQAAARGTGLVPPPVDELRRYRYVQSPDEIGAARPVPVLGSTTY